MREFPPFLKRESNQKYNKPRIKVEPSQRTGDEASFGQYQRKKERIKGMENEETERHIKKRERYQTITAVHEIPGFSVIGFCFSPSWHSNYILLTNFGISILTTTFSTPSTKKTTTNLTNVTPHHFDVCLF